MGSEGEKSIVKEEKTGDDVLSLKEKGDELYKEKKYQEALECYDEAISKDNLNLELLACKAQIYYDLKDYSTCLYWARKIFDHSTNVKNMYKSAPVSRALKLIALAKRAYVFFDVLNQPRRFKQDDILKAFLQAMLCVPAIEIEPLITQFNAWRKEGAGNSFTTRLKAGVMLYSYGNLTRAIEEFTEEISSDKINSLAYACRAICYASRGPNYVDKLLGDVKECIDLDYRFHNYFLHKADEFKLLGRIDASFRLYKALSSSAETYKLSAGNFFPKLLIGEKLSKSERRRFKDFDESWRKNYFLPLEELYRNSELDSDSESQSDSDNIKAAEKSKETNVNEHTLCLREKGDKLFEEEKFEEALECYSKAIEQDDSNLDLLLCKAKVYFSMKKYSECIMEAEKLVALSINQGKYRSSVVFEALRLIASSQGSLEQFKAAIEVSTKAMRFSVPNVEIELLITDYNKWHCHNHHSAKIIDRSASNAALQSGIMLYAGGDNEEARLIFDSAISLDHCNPLARACKFVWLFENDYGVREEVKQCIDLDYRYLTYFINKADEMKLNGRMAGAYKLYEALSSVEETYKSSVGKFFPNLLRNPRLNKSERKRFEDLEESWRENYLPILKGFDKKFDLNSE